jgi:hypothetical protein
MAAAARLSERRGRSKAAASSALAPSRGPLVRKKSTTSSALRSPAAAPEPVRPWMAHSAHCVPAPARLSPAAAPKQVFPWEAYSARWLLAPAAPLSAHPVHGHDHVPRALASGVPCASQQDMHRARGLLEQAPQDQAPKHADAPDCAVCSGGSTGTHCSTGSAAAHSCNTVAHSRGLMDHAGWFFNVRSVGTAHGGGHARQRAAGRACVGERDADVVAAGAVAARVRLGRRRDAQLAVPPAGVRQPVAERVYHRYLRRAHTRACAVWGSSSVPRLTGAGRRPAPAAGVHICMRSLGQQLGAPLGLTRDGERPGQ